MDNAGGFLGMGFVDEIDQLAFAVGLSAIGLEAEARCGLDAKLFDVGQRGVAIGRGARASQQIKVRTVEDVDRLGR